MRQDVFEDLRTEMAAEPGPRPEAIEVMSQRLMTAVAREHAKLDASGHKRVPIKLRLSALSERARFALSLAVVIVLAVAVFVVPVPQLFHFGPGSHPGSRPAAGAPVPKSFSPLSVAAVGSKDLWVLGSVSCDRSHECPAIAHTSDGGGSFEALPVPPSGISVGSGAFDDAGIVFADAEHGWVYGPGLWASDDGGSTWTEERVKGTVMKMATADGEVYALVCPKGLNLCEHNRSLPTMQLLRAPVSQGAFASVALPAVLHFGSSLAVHDSTVAVMNGLSNKASVLAVSTDAGAKFALEATSCTPGLSGAVYATLLSGAVLWESCPTGMMAEAGVSTDDGSTWRELSPEQFTNGLGIAALSASTALMWPAPPSLNLALTTDGGASFRTVMKGPQPTPESGHEIIWAGFADPTRAYAIVHGPDYALQQNELWESGDGGRVWAELHLTS